MSWCKSVGLDSTSLLNSPYSNRVDVATRCEDYSVSCALFQHRQTPPRPSPEESSKKVFSIWNTMLSVSTFPHCERPCNSPQIVDIRWPCFGCLEPESALKSKDTNCDDRVSYTEFVKWLFHGSKEARQTLHALNPLSSNKAVLIFRSSPCLSPS